MPLDARRFWQPKDEGFADDYEDALAFSGEREIAAVADGVAGGMFSGRWAQLLTEAIVENPPDPRDREALVRWLEPLRRTWDLAIDRPSLKWMQRQKLQQAGGGYTTLLWLEMLPGQPAGDDGRPAESFAYRSVALGDCCLFHVRGAEVLRSFPMEKSEDFGLDPPSICSVDRNRDQMLDFKELEGTCCFGDLLVLATDAIAAWMLRQLEAGNQVPWDEFRQMTEGDFADWLRSVRAGGEIRYDDSTLLLLKVLTEEELALAAQEPAVPAEEAGQSGAGVTAAGEQEEAPSPEEADPSATGHGEEDPCTTDVAPADSGQGDG